MNQPCMGRKRVCAVELAAAPRCNCEFWPSRVPTYPHSQLAARSAAIPTYPPSGAEFRERPPSGRAQRYLPTLAWCLPAPRPYLPTLAQVFPIAAVTYLPGQRDATQSAQRALRRELRAHPHPGDAERGGRRTLAPRGRCRGGPCRSLCGLLGRSVCSSICCCVCELHCGVI